MADAKNPMEVDLNVNKSVLTDEKSVGAYYTHDQSHLLELIRGRPQSAIELGCAAGNFLSTLANHGVGKLTGVEYTPKASALAQQALPSAKILCGDFLRVSMEDIGENYDLAVASHVLEHFTDPSAAVLRVCALLKPGGQFIGAVPNVRHLSVTLPLIVKGQWEYQDEGILDRTHYHFFTKASIYTMLKRSGFTDISVLPRLATGKARMAARATFGMLTDQVTREYMFSAIKAVR